VDAPELWVYIVLLIGRHHKEPTKFIPFSFPFFFSTKSNNVNCSSSSCESSLHTRNDSRPRLPILNLTGSLSRSLLMPLSLSKIGNRWLHHSDTTGALRRPPNIEGGHFWASGDERVDCEAGPPVDSPSTHLRSPCTQPAFRVSAGKSGVGRGETEIRPRSRRALSFSKIPDYVCQHFGCGKYKR
jgi:hypothetical protein